MVLSGLQILSLKRFVLAQALVLTGFFLFSFFFQDKTYSFYIGGLLGEGYMSLIFFLGLIFIKQKSKALALCIIILKWPLLALLLYNLLKFVDKLNFVLGLSYAVIGFWLSLLIARRKN